MVLICGVDCDNGAQAQYFFLKTSVLSGEIPADKQGFGKQKTVFCWQLPIGWNNGSFFGLRDM